MRAGRARRHGSRVKNVDEYRKHAEECRQLARLALTRKERDELLELATTWERLANHRVASLAAKHGPGSATRSEPPALTGGCAAGLPEPCR